MVPAAGLVAARAGFRCRKACSLCRMPAVARSGAAADLAALLAFRAASAAHLASKASASLGQCSCTVLTRRALTSVVLPFASSLSESLILVCMSPKKQLAVTNRASHFSPQSAPSRGLLQECNAAACLLLTEKAVAGRNPGLLGRASHAAKIPTLTSDRCQSLPQQIPQRCASTS